MSSHDTGRGLTGSFPAPNARASAFVLAGPRAAGMMVALIGLLVLAGWVLHVEALKRALPGLDTMKINAAVALLGIGASLWSTREVGPPSAVSRAAACVALSIALANLFEYATGVSLGIDEAIFRDDTTSRMGWSVQSRRARGSILTDERPG